MTHQRYCPMQAFNHSDAAKRVSDEYTLHRLADGLGFSSFGKWIACALADGASDHTLYDTKQDAVRHQHHNEHHYCYIKIGPAQMTICDAEIYLITQRKLHDAGFRMADPDHITGGKEVIKRVSGEDQTNQMIGYNTNLILPY